MFALLSAKEKLQLVLQQKRMRLYITNKIQIKTTLLDLLFHRASEVFRIFALYSQTRIAITISDYRFSIKKENKKLKIHSLKDESVYR